MESIFVVDRDLFAGFDVAQGKEQHVPVECFHVGIWFAAVIDVVSAVAATTAVQTPATIDIADAELGPM